MIRGEEFFTSVAKKTRVAIQEISPDKFDNPIDYIFKKAYYDAELQAYQSATVEHRKYAAESSEEEAAILMHSACKVKSDTHRLELGKIEKLEHQEDAKITADRGRLNGLIDGYNNVRIHFDLLTSEFAAAHERKK